MPKEDCYSLEEVNGFCAEKFISVFGNVVEHCPLAAATAWQYRPFASVDRLTDAIGRFLQSLPADAQAGVLRCMPDLAGKLAEENCLTEESLKEHAAAGLHCLSSEERQTIRQGNAAYKEKFGFPFVICSRENRVASIIKGLETRQHNGVEEEIKTGIREVKKICSLRVKDIITSKL